MFSSKRGSTPFSCLYANSFMGVPVCSQSAMHRPEMWCVSLKGTPFRTRQSATSVPSMKGSRAVFIFSGLDTLGDLDAVRDRLNMVQHRLHAFLWVLIVGTRSPASQPETVNAVLKLEQSPREHSERRGSSCIAARERHEALSKYIIFIS